MGQPALLFMGFMVGVVMALYLYIQLRKVTYPLPLTPNP